MVGIPDCLLCDTDVYSQSKGDAKQICPKSTLLMQRRDSEWCVTAQLGEAKHAVGAQANSRFKPLVPQLCRRFRQRASEAISNDGEYSLHLRTYSCLLVEVGLRELPRYGGVTLSSQYVHTSHHLAEASLFLVTWRVSTTQ